MCNDAPIFIKREQTIVLDQNFAKIILSFVQVTHKISML